METVTGMTVVATLVERCHFSGLAFWLGVLVSAFLFIFISLFNGLIMIFLSCTKKSQILSMPQTLSLVLASQINHLAFAPILLVSDIAAVIPPGDVESKISRSNQVSWRVGLR